MKGLALRGGLVLALVLMATSQASAWNCYKCVYHGFVESGGIYWPIYLCDTQSGFCSSCHVDCIEQDGSYCRLGTACEWAKLEGSADPGDSKAVTRATPVHPAP